MVSLPLVLQWVYGLNVKGDNIHVSLSLVCYSEYIIMLDVKDDNIHVAMLTCFRMGVCAECDNMQNYCHYRLFDMLNVTAGHNTHVVIMSCFTVNI